MRIDILVADNTYGTAIHFSKALAAALEKQGANTRLLWIDQGYFFQAFYDILEDPPDFTCSFSDISLAGQPLGNLWQIPHLFLMVDPPIYFMHQFTSKYGWVSCVDQKDCAFVQALNLIPAFFLPHAVDKQLYTPCENPRIYENVFFGSCIDYEEVAIGWSKNEKELLLTASQKVLSSSPLSIIEALIELGVQEINLARYHNEVDRYIRGKDRIELIRCFGEKEVHIWGEGPWKKFFPQHTLHPPVNFEQILEIMKNSYLVLNSSPRFKAGAHERIFYALLCGANVYTATNPYLSTIFPELNTYAYGEWERPKFKSQLEHIESAQKKVLTSHTWDNRAEQLLTQLTYKN